MNSYQILVSGYFRGYITSQLITVQADSIDDAYERAEQESYLDGAESVR